MIAGFYEIQPVGKGDPDYDHIMPIVGITKDKKYIQFFDLANTKVRKMSTKISTRKEAQDPNMKNMPDDEKVWQYTMSQSKNAITIKGIVDSNKLTYRMILEVNNPSEPDWGKEDKLNQKPIQLTFGA